jgi:hypothetical protein
MLRKIQRRDEAKDYTHPLPVLHQAPARSTKPIPTSIYTSTACACPRKNRRRYRDRHWRAHAAANPVSRLTFPSPTSIPIPPSPIHPIPIHPIPASVRPACATARAQIDGHAISPMPPTLLALSGVDPGLPSPPPTDRAPPALPAPHAPGISESG